MTDAPTNPRASMGSFDLRFMQRGKHSALLYIPEECYAPIGRIIAHWGNFEERFNGCLAALINAEASSGVTRDTTGWRRFKFKGRRRLFKEVCSNWLAVKSPNPAKALCGIADTAGDLATKRNVIAHGFYTYTIPPFSEVATNLRAVNSETGTDFPFDLDILVKLYHDISHLTGDLIMAFAEIGTIGDAPVALPDIEILRVFRQTTHRLNPSSHTQPPPPASSQE